MLVAEDQLKTYLNEMVHHEGGNASATPLGMYCNVRYVGLCGHGNSGRSVTIAAPAIIWNGVNAHTRKKARITNLFGRHEGCADHH
jgi:hypothetical protein